jgi:enamine deaminase RidA (YjgF/YER057c/UK114 family)
MTKRVLVPDEKGRNFARAVRAGQFLYLSGMTGQWDLKTWEQDPRAAGDAGYQTKRIYEWAARVLGQCGLTLADVVSTTTYLKSMKDLEAVARAKRDIPGAGTAASTTVAVSEIVGIGLLEINFVALYPDGK